MASEARAAGVTIYGLAHLALDAFGPMTADAIHRVICEDAKGLEGDEAADLSLSRVKRALAAACCAGTISAESIKYSAPVYSLTKWGPAAP